MVTPGRLDFANRNAGFGYLSTRDARRGLRVTNGIHQHSGQRLPWRERALAPIATVHRALRFGLQYLPCDNVRVTGITAAANPPHASATLSETSVLTLVDLQQRGGQA